MSLKSQPKKTKHKNEGKEKNLFTFIADFCRSLSERERETKMPPQSLIVPIAQ